MADNIYVKVTNTIIAAIESGAGKYTMPWTVRADKGFSPLSIGSGKPYRGINTLVLWAQAQTQEYSSALWGTFQQWDQLGAHVRKGEKGSPVVYWGRFENKSEHNEAGDGGASEESSTRMFARGYNVFNADQVDDLKMSKRFEPKLSHNERIGRAESFFAPLAQVRDGGNRAFYRPDTPEAVYMPGFDQFPEPEQYYSVLAHEHTHWTAHESRCGRELGKRFGDSAYAVEELIAELGSAYTMAHLELELTPRLDHSAYCASWLKVLKADTRAVFNAASAAQKAADWMIVAQQAKVNVA